MKKICSILLIVLSLLIVNTITVNAKEDLAIDIIGVKQGNEDLKTDDNGIYQVTGTDRLSLIYSLKGTGVEEKKEYYMIIDDGGIILYGEDLLGNNKMEFTFYPKSQITELELKVCTDNACSEDNLLASKKFKLNITFFDQLENINNGYTEIEKIYQGGNEITPIYNELYDNYTIKYNSIEDIILNLKGYNYATNIPYEIQIYNNNFSHIYNNIYKGKELNSGITLTVPMNDPNYDFFDLNIYPDVRFLNQRDSKIKYKGLNVVYEKVDYDKTKPTYEFSLGYANFKDKKINKAESEYLNYYIINNEYHNENNPLLLNLKCSNCENKDYNVKVLILNNQDKEVYKKDFSVNGTKLNNNYEYTINDFTMQKLKDYNINNEDGYYRIYVTINNITYKNEYKYMFGSKESILKSDIFYENGKKNLSSFAGDGNCFSTMLLYETNNQAFTKFSTIYIYYKGKNFETNTMYDYILEYGYSDFDDPRGEGYYYEKVLKEGKISGLQLNTIGMLVGVDNKSNYKLPTYRLTIKKGDEIIYYNSPVLNLIDKPTLASVSLKTNNKNLYLQMEDSSYIATRNAPIFSNITGIGFDDNKEYRLDMCVSTNDIEGQECDIYKFKGKEINNGVSIKANQKITKDVNNMKFLVIIEEVGAHGQYEVNFVDSKDFFPTIKNYIVDNVNDLIKNISKNTDVKDFKNNIKVTNNGSVKVYDKTGVNEISNKVGTGMIARIVDEYDRNIMDIDIVVKGDVTGDGNISITDLVKVKQHLAELSSLDGVYEIAGDITNTGSISLTDLIKVSRDVARIEEIK